MKRRTYKVSATGPEGEVAFETISLTTAIELANSYEHAGYTRICVEWPEERPLQRPGEERLPWWITATR